MKITIIIYVVSWLILLAIYISSRVKKNSTSLLSNDSEPWYAYLLFAIFSPIVVIVIPYILIRDFKSNREKKKKDAEKRQREEEEKKRKLMAMRNFEAAVKTGSFSITTEFFYIANKLQDLVKNEQYDNFLSCLNKLTLPDDSFLVFEGPKEEGHGDSSKLLVVKPDVCDYEIWNHITVEDSHMGAWQAYLLNSIKYTLPLFWHAIYGKRSYVYSEDDIVRIEHIRESTPKEFELIKHLDLAPIVVKYGSKYYIMCYYWNDWSGLNKEYTEISIENNKPVISTINREIIIEYDCGIRF